MPYIRQHWGNPKHTGPLFFAAACRQEGANSFPIPNLLSPHPPGSSAGGGTAGACENGSGASGLQNSSSAPEGEILTQLEGCFSRELVGACSLFWKPNCRRWMRRQICSPAPPVETLTLLNSPDTITGQSLCDRLWHYGFNGILPAGISMSFSQVELRGPLLAGNCCFVNLMNGSLGNNWENAY